MFHSGAEVDGLRTCTPSELLLGPGLDRVRVSWAPNTGADSPSPWPMTFTLKDQTCSLYDHETTQTRTALPDCA